MALIKVKDIKITTYPRKGTETGKQLKYEDLMYNYNLSP